MKEPHIDLDEWISAENYHGYSVEEWQRGTRDSLGKLLEAAIKPSKGPFTSYNQDYLSQKLSSIHWDGIFAQHDQFVSSRENHSDSSVGRKGTLLDRLLDFFRNPIIWPYACQLALLSALVKGLESHCIHLDVRQRRLSPSQKTTRKFILQNLRRMPSLRNRQSPSILQPPINVSSLSIVHLRMGLMKEWMFAFPDWKTSMMPCFLDILNVLDLIDYQDEVKAMPSKPFQETKRRMDKGTQRVRGSLQSIDRLHGDEDAEGSPHVSVQRSRTQGYLATKLLASTVDSMDSVIGERERKARQIIRGNCMEILLTMYDTGYSTRFVSQMLSHFVNFPHRGAASICWFMVKFVHRVSLTDSINLADFARMVWGRRNHDVSKSSIVAFYFEMLAECSYFDNPDNLWFSLTPFVEFVEEQTTESRSDEELEHTPSSHNFEQSTVKNPAPPDSSCSRPTETSLKRQEIQLILHWFGALLVQRRAILKHRGKEFRALCDQLSSLYDDDKLWLEHYCMERDRRMIEEALFDSGILTFTDPTNRISIRTKSWSKPTRIKCGMRLCEPADHHTDLLSKMSKRNGIPHYLMETSSSPPTPFSMNMDTESNVLGFLSYEKLVEVRKVCKAWRNAADNSILWRNLYEKRFAFRKDDTRASDESQPWKSLFEDMIYAERVQRALPGNRPQSHTICPFVGCTKIFPTKRMQNHCRSHLKTEKRLKKHRRGTSKTGTEQPNQSPQTGFKRKKNTNRTIGENAKSPKKTKHQTLRENAELKSQILSVFEEHRLGFVNLSAQGNAHDGEIESMRKDNVARIEGLYSAMGKAYDRGKISNTLIQVEHSIS